jgi:YD repeat-containing protein
VRALALSTILVCAASARASETTTYAYDARGRLISVAHSGGPSAGGTTSYSIDNADNRTNKTTSGLGGGTGGVNFTISSNGAVTEGANSAFTVTKNNTASTSVSVNYATANGTATQPGDYASTSGTLTFTTAQTVKTVNVTTVNDSAVESPETFTMSLSAPTGGATLGSPSSATATINDNDGGGGNQPPVANPDDGGVILTCHTVDINVVANDTDPDNNLPLSVVSATNVSGGISATKISSTTVEVQSLSENTGTKTFSYVVQDSLGATANGTGTVTVQTGGVCP